MEHALTHSGFECIHSWADFIGRYSELLGMCGAKPLDAVIEAMSEDVAAGLMPRDEKLDAIVASLRRNPDFSIWARAANIACSLLLPPPSSAPAAGSRALFAKVPSLVKEAALKEHATVAKRLRILWLAVHDFMERNPEGAAEWAAGGVSDGTLSRMLVQLPDQEPIRQVLRLVNVLSAVMLLLHGRGALGGENAGRGICSLQSAQGVWKRKPAYPGGGGQGRRTVYGAASTIESTPIASGVVSLTGGVALLCAVAAFLALSRRPPPPPSL